MIILITGASHSGKTLLAQRMLEKIKYPYLSIDHLKMGLIRSGGTPLTPLEDTSCTIDSLKADNHAFRKGFEQSGEQILLIESDFLQTVDSWTTL